MSKDFYKILSLIFYRPDREFTAYLRDGFIQDIEFLGEDAVAGFSAFLAENSEKDRDEFYKMLAVEYTRLFTNAIPAVPCPPYESIYREDIIMGNSTLCILECYNKAGLKVTEKFHDLPDHVAVELEFLYCLMSYGYTKEHDFFMEEHFSKWVPEFCGEVEKNDRTDFYKHAAVALKEFIKREEWKKNGRV